MKTATRKPETEVKKTHLEGWPEDAQKMLQGASLVGKQFAEPLDITDFLGSTFVLEYKRTEDFEYEYNGEPKKGVSHVGILRESSNPTPDVQNLIGKEVGVFGRGLLNYLVKEAKMAEGTKFAIIAFDKKEIKGGNKAYQFKLATF